MFNWGGAGFIGEVLVKKKAKKSSPKRGVLICVSGKFRDEAIKLRRDSTIFGRESADIVIYDQEVSSTHCQIQNIDGTYHIFDMNSSNGTLLNKERIVKSKLKDGDNILIGKTSFRFVLQDEKTVRNMPTFFKGSQGKKSNKKTSIVTSLIEKELASSQKNYMVMVITYDGSFSETIELKSKIVYLGRATSFGRFDQDSKISRKHIKIKLNDIGEIFVEDQGSTNGSFINNKKINGMHKVMPSDELRIGSCRFYIKKKK